MHKRLIILFCLLFSLVFAEVSMIELPIRMEFNYSKRVPGQLEFFIVTRLSGSGTLIAIPENEIGRFKQLAIDEGFNDAQVGDLDYLPSYWAAVGEVGKATIALEHTGELAFFRNERGYWITWDDEHPAPVETVNGVPITEWFVANLPNTPGPAAVRPED